MLVHFQRVPVCSDEEDDPLDLKNKILEASGFSTKSQHAAASSQKNKNMGIEKIFVLVVSKESSCRCRGGYDIETISSFSWQYFIF